MRLRDLRAIAHPDGNRIDLSWINPDPANYPRVQVRRGTRAYPATADQGSPVPESSKVEQIRLPNGEVRCTLADKGLHGETVYYYALFPQKDGGESGAGADADNVHNRAAAMATAPYAMAGQMYDLLPGIYRRYDAGQEQLRHFLELPGGQLDQLYSLTRALLNLHDVEQVDGRLLPLLADWIGWPTDHRRDLGAQRNELAAAPYIYPRIGIIPTVEATVKRLLGWESRAKEFCHNVCVTNRPECLNLWALKQDDGGQWSEPKLLSLDFAYEGRPAAVKDKEETWLFYHTLRQGHWDIWYKRCNQEGQWQPSQPLTDRPDADRHPTAAVLDGELWVFWDVYDGAGWRIDYCVSAKKDEAEDQGKWSTPNELSKADNKPPDRRRPCAVTDEQGSLWVFWLQRDSASATWHVRYNHLDKTPPGDGWETDFLNNSLTVKWSTESVKPETSELIIEDDLSVLFQAADDKESENPRLYVLGVARLDPTDQGQTKTSERATKRSRGKIRQSQNNPQEDRQARWRIVCSYMDIDGSPPNIWKPMLISDAAAKDSDDREPVARAYVDAQQKGKIDLYWSSNRDGSWSIWQVDLIDTPGSPKPLTSGPYTQRAPLPVQIGNTVQLLYRSNQGVPYRSQVYGATETLDNRYAGCTTVDTRNTAKRNLRGQFEDFQTYTYDTRQTNDAHFARDTVGIYLSAAARDQKLVVSDRAQMQEVLRQFLPLTVRTVVIVPLITSETIYDTPDQIGERYQDAIALTHEEKYSGLAEGRYRDVASWHLLCTWQHGQADGQTSNSQYRTWHRTVEAGGTDHGTS